MIKKMGVLIAEEFIYLIMVIIGIVTMIFPELGFNQPTLYSAILFFAIVFFGIVGYFITRDKREDYELLLLSLVSIFSASYLFIINYTGVSYILGTGFLIFTVLTSMSKIYYINAMRKQGNQMWLLRSISLILILFLSTLTIQNFYREVSEVQTVMVGYFFVVYGVISASEMLLLAYVKPKSFERFINGEFDNPEKLKSLKKHNENIEELDKVVKEIDAPKRKTKKKKTTTKKRVSYKRKK